MTMRSWIRSRFTRPATRTIRKAPRRARLRLEALEDRVVPATITVTNTADSGTGSLRDAIAQANASVGVADTIVFSSLFNSPQTITQTSGGLTLTDAATTTITGPGAQLLSVSGSAFSIAAGASAALSGLTRSNAATGVFNSGTLTMTNCMVSNSQERGVYNEGTLTMTNCDVWDTFSVYGGDLIGVENRGTLNMTSCDIDRTEGSGSRVFGVRNFGELNMTNSTVSRTTGDTSVANAAPNAIGVDNYQLSGGPPAVLRMTNCSVTGTSSPANAIGVNNEFAGQASLLNCTVARNSSLLNIGMGVENSGSLVMTSCTVSGNTSGSSTGGGITGNGINLVNTIVAGNLAANVPADVYGFVTGSFNLIGDGTGLFGITNGSGNNQIGTRANPINPLLSFLSYYGGPTVGTGTDSLVRSPLLTMPLLPGSPAIGRGTITSAFFGNTDQRGVPRTNVPVDIGAFQTQGVLVVNTTADATLADQTFFGLVSLRDAVNRALPYTSITISFSPIIFATPQTITLSGTPLELMRGTSENVTITGPAAGVTISGNNASRVFQVDPGVTATLSGLTITNGVAAQGGGLLNDGNLTLNNVVFANNSARGSDGARGGYTVATGTNAVSVFPGGVGSPGEGGALYARAGSVTITNSTFTNNTAQGGAGGAGGDGKPVMLPNGTTANVSATNGGSGGTGNGGAIVVSNGSMAITNSTFSNNTASGGAGGAGGAYLNTTVAGSPGSGGAGGAGLGGAISTGFGAAFTISLSITNSTFSGLTATPGLGGVGGINTPISAARGANGSAGASQGGALLVNSGSVLVSNATFANVNASSGGGIALIGGALTLNNTILGANTGGAIVKAGGTLAGGSNLIVDSTATIAGFTGTIHADPKLGPLANNGGPTQTMQLLTGSPAIDKGNNALVPAGVTTDQLGKPRLVKGISTAATAVVDIGAAEAPDPVGPTGDLIVNSLGDDGSDGTLRWAVNQANATPGPDTITFDPNVFSTLQTIALSGTPLELMDTNGTTTIVGPESGVIIDADGQSRVFQVDSGVTADLGGLILTGGSAVNGAGLDNAGVATLTDVTLTGNNATGNGGGVFTEASGTTTLIEAVVTGNSATGNGGGVYNNGGITQLTDSTSVSYNTAGQNGGGLFTRTGELTLTDSSVTGNAAGQNGGGLYSDAVANQGAPVLTGCTVSGNTAVAGGGGLFEKAGQASLTDCTVSGNTASAGGGLQGIFGASPTLTGCTISGNSGGGIDNSFGTLRLTGCTLDDNTGGSGITTYNSFVHMNDCVVSGNAGVLGGGLTCRISFLALSDCTISGNTGVSGGGLYTLDSRTLNGVLSSLTDCTISDNSATLAGGGVCSAATGNPGVGTTTLTGCTVSDNHAGQGGGLANAGDPLTVSDSTIGGNDAAFGGGVFTTAAGITDLEGVTVSDNSAWGGGGVYNDVNSATTLKDAEVSNNSAGDTGSGVYNTGGSTELVNTAVSNNSAGNTGSGVVNDGGTVNQDAQSTVSNNTAAVSGGDVVLDATFSNLSSPTIVYGTTTTTFTGHMGSGSNVPLESFVSITLNEVTQIASIDAGGDFASTFHTSSLNVAGGPYTVTYSFAGNGAFNAVSDSSTTLTVTPAPLSVTAASQSMTYGGAVPALTYTYTGLVNGDTTATFSGGLATSATSSSNVGDYAINQGDLAATGNYQIESFTAASLTINKADATIVVAGYSGKYDGVAHGASLVSATGVDPNGTALGTSFTTTTVTDVPGGTVSWTFHGGLNYNDQSGTADVVITPPPFLPNNTGTFTDSDGDKYTVTLTPAGVGKIAVGQDDPTGSGKGPIQGILLQGTDPTRSVLTITVVKAKTGDGLVSIGAIGGSGLKLIKAPDCDLVGAGIDLSDFLGGVTLHDLASGTQVVAGGTATQSTTLSAHVVGSGTVIQFGSTIASLTAAAVQGGSITAPSLGTLNITGDAQFKVNGVRKPIAGDFDAALTLTGTGNPRNPTALGKATIAGGIENAGWDISGDAGTVTARGTIDGWTVNVHGKLAGLTLGSVAQASVTVDQTLATLSAKGWAAGALTAASLGTLSITGNFGANVTLTGTGDPKKPTALGSATITGGIQNAAWNISGDSGTVTARGTITGWTVNVHGKLAGLTLGSVAQASVTVDKSLATLSAKGWTVGALTAASLGTLSITGDLGANVTLTGAGLPARTPALSSARITGTVVGSSLAVAGSVGTFTAGAFIGSTLYVGFVPTSAIDPLGGGVFTPGLKVGSFTVTGLPHQSAAAFVDSTVAADTVGNVSLKSVQADNAGQKYGIVAHTGISSVRVGSPVFVFNKVRPTPQGTGDFEVELS